MDHERWKIVLRTGVCRLPNHYLSLEKSRLSPFSTYARTSRAPDPLRCIRNINFFHRQQLFTARSNRLVIELLQATDLRLFGKRTDHIRDHAVGNLLSELL